MGVRSRRALEKGKADWSSAQGACAEVRVTEVRDGDAETSALPKASLLPKMPPVKMPQVGKTFVFNYRRIINSETRIVAATEEDAKAIFSLGQWALDGNETTEEEFESISFREVQDS